MKQLDWVNLTTNGDGIGPAVGNSSTFSYCVVDGDLSKCGTYTPNLPEYADSVETFWTDAIAAIKALENIA